MTEKKARECIVKYFASRKVPRRDGEGKVLVNRDGEVLYDLRPSTVTGLALALGLSSRQELYQIREKRVKALVSRALLKIEEEAEEKLFSKDSYQGAKAFLDANFIHHGEMEEESDLGLCSVWAE